MSASIGAITTPAAEATSSCTSTAPSTDAAAQSPVRSPTLSHNDGACGKDLLAHAPATSGWGASTSLNDSLHHEVANDPAAPKPEPATLLLVGATLAALGIAARRRAAARRGQTLQSDIAGG